MNSFFSVILLPSDDSFNKGCCQILPAFSSLPRKSVGLVLWADHFIIVFRNRLYKTESAVSNIVGSLYF